jgi:predicted RecA/RadA family phage recombinase
MAQYQKGSYPQYVDYTPASDVAAGDVVQDGDTLLICTGGIKANGGGIGITAGHKGAMVCRGGVFLVTTDGAIGTRKRVYWDATNHVITLTRGVNLQFGFTGDTAATGAQTIPCEFAPGRGDEATSTVAATGSTIADAAALSDGFNLVTGADGTKGVILPLGSKGRVVKVKNNTAAVLKVYPANVAGQTINALTALAAISMASLSSADFESYDGTTWYTNPTVPS